MKTGSCTSKGSQLALPRAELFINTLCSASCIGPFLRLMSLTPMCAPYNEVYVYMHCNEVVCLANFA